MYKKKVAIFLDTRKESGGEYQHLLYTIENIKRNNKDKVKFLIICLSKKLNLDLNFQDIEIKYFSLNFFERFVCYLRNYGNFTRRIKRFYFFKNKFENYLKKNNVDLVYFTSPSQYSLYLENTKFIITIPDVDHREHVEFPEIVDDGEYQRKEEIFSKSLPRAQAVITNAKIIKQRLIKYYNISEKRIFIINLRPAMSVKNFSLSNIDLNENNKIIRKFNLPKNYIFYPAMYLPHKNHKTLIDSVELLNKNSNNKLKVVFSGSDIGYKRKIQTYVSKKGMISDITFLNFVENHELPYLYLNSSLIVFPVLIGPTFTPLWEAFKMERPVIFSDLEGVHDVYGEGVEYINPLNPLDISNAIKKILNDNEFKLNLIKKGKEQLNKIENQNEYQQVFDIIKNFRNINSTWTFEK